MITLRDYQQDVVDSIYKTQKRGIARQLVVMSTGMGKTHVMTYIIKEKVKRGERVLVLVDQEDLVWQWKRSILAADGNIQIGIEKAEYKAKMTDQVVVATVQTLGRKGVKRIKRFKDNHFTTAIADEAHKSISSTWFRVLNYFGFGKENFHDGNLFLGTTATPYRNSGESLGMLYDDIVANYDLRYAMSEGWLTDVQLYDIQTTTDLSKYKNQGEFDLAVNNEERNVEALKAYKEICNGEQALVYTASVDHAYQLKELFNANGVPSEVIEANTDKSERKGYLKDYMSKDIKCLFNYATLCLDEETEILTDEGWCSMEDIDYNKNVANWEEGKVWFDKPKFIVKRDRLPEEKMAFLQNRMNSIRVTEHHKMLWTSQYMADKGKPHKKNKISELINKPFLLLPVYGESNPKKINNKIDNSLTTKQYKKRIAVNSYGLRKRNGVSFEDSKRIAKERLNLHLKLQYKNPDELSNEECSFLGFWFGDGSIWKDSNNSTRINLSQNKKDTNIVYWIDNLIKELKLDCSRNEKKSVIEWTIGKGTGYGQQKVNGFYPYLPYLSKTDLTWLWGLNKEQFEYFILGFFVADGSHGNDIPVIKDRYNISNTNKVALDTVQAVGVCRGLKISIDCGSKRKHYKTMYRMSISKRPHYHLGYNSFSYEEDWKEEKVWCVTTHSSNIITRRRGKVTVMGNTTGTDLPETKALMLLRPIQSKLLLTQIVGRGLRPSSTAMVDVWNNKKDRLHAIELSDKPYCKIIDLHDKVGRHNFAHVPSLFGLHNKLKTKEPKRFFKEVVEPLDQAKKEHGIDTTTVINPEDIKLLVKKRKVKITSLKTPDNIQEFTNRSWMQTETGYEIIYPDNILVIEKDQSKSSLLDKDEYHLFDYNKKDKTTKQLQTFNSVSGAFKIADEYADMKKWSKSFVEKSEWQEKGVTKQQLGLLTRFYSYRNGYSKFRLLEERYPDTETRKVFWKPTGEVLDRGSASKLITDMFSK